MPLGTIASITVSLREVGFTQRGAFHPSADDDVPDIKNNEPTLTLVLAGNVGPAMWERFTSERDPTIDLLDEWSEDVIGKVAKLHGGKAFFPFHEPYLPFQRWAQRAEACYASPLGMFIHSEYGLWHGYRGALAFPEKLQLPAVQNSPNPCISCEMKPCLGACPVGAFRTYESDAACIKANYNVSACVKHLGLPIGNDCMQLGCRARRACPEGISARYKPEQANFHMRAFLRASRIKEGSNI